MEHEEKRAALDQLLHRKDISWHHASHSVVFAVSRMGRTRYHVILNAY